MYKVPKPKEMDMFTYIISDRKIILARMQTKPSMMYEFMYAPREWINEFKYTETEFTLSSGKMLPYVKLSKEDKSEFINKMLYLGVLVEIDLVFGIFRIRMVKQPNEKRNDIYYNYKDIVILGEDEVLMSKL